MSKSVQINSFLLVLTLFSPGFTLVLTLFSPGFTLVLTLFFPWFWPCFDSVLPGFDLVLTLETCVLTLGNPCFDPGNPCWDPWETPVHAHVTPVSVYTSFLRCSRTPLDPCTGQPGRRHHSCAMVQKRHFWVQPRPRAWAKHLENPVLGCQNGRKTGILGLLEACFEAQNSVFWPILPQNTLCFTCVFGQEMT